MSKTTTIQAVFGLYKNGAPETCKVVPASSQQTITPPALIIICSADGIFSQQSSKSEVLYLCASLRLDCCEVLTLEECTQVTAWQKSGTVLECAKLFFGCDAFAFFSTTGSLECKIRLWQACLIGWLEEMRLQSKRKDRVINGIRSRYGNWPT